MAARNPGLLLGWRGMDLTSSEIRELVVTTPADDLCSLSRTWPQSLLRFSLETGGGILEEWHVYWRVLKLHTTLFLCEPQHQLKRSKNHLTPQHNPAACVGTPEKVLRVPRESWSLILEVRGMSALTHFLSRWHTFAALRTLSTPQSFCSSGASMPSLKRQPGGGGSSHRTRNREKSPPIGVQYNQLSRSRLRQ